jgi:hypothetical protein
VAGVIRSGERPLDCMVRKIAAEASVPHEYIMGKTTSCGTVWYQTSTISTGAPGCQHIISYLHDMELGHYLAARE